MPWQEVNTMSLRREFVALALAGDLSMAELCRRYQIARKTGYKWLNRYNQSGDDGLIDLPRTPRSSPTRTPQEVEQLILEVRANSNGVWCGRKIRSYLINHGMAHPPSASTITEILRRHGRLTPSERLQRDWVRFEHEAPNLLWQMDFKGPFPTDRASCHPLTVLDDHSRFSLVLAACANETRQPVQQALTEAFRRYGLPLRMTMDNGNPWGNSHRRYTQLAVWMIQVGIQISYSRPYHPQTQGKDERFHRTFKAEVITGRHFLDLDHCQAAFDDWRSIYNFERPHEALGQQVPADRYTPSPRPFPERIEPFEYASDDQLRKVQSTGQFSFRGRIFKASEAFQGHQIALRPTLIDGCFEVYFRHQRIGEIDLHSEDKTVTHVSEHV